MYNIKYLSKNNEDYTDKQKVYFSCHPEDRNLYLDLLAKDIFQYSDCAVFYDEKPDAEYDKDDYQNLLRSANLIVVPVTAKFLSEPNRSCDFDIKFALENFIPVMPVMMETGLEQSFNAVVGDLQLLDRTNCDSTAVAYTEKLKNYLESVLADTQLLQDINNSFCAKIFLSYRKKDRAHANRLMQLIHSCEEFRDVAIWYDEFLTTGEDYNKSIEKALVQSDIFALAVTPNLLEKDNYVMTTEFPDAIKHQKDMLAVELTELKADKKAEFSAAFSGCPAPISADQPQLVADRLQQILQKLEISPAKDTPQHRYLIGLAYLGGINVEKNAEKALSLIKSAAKDKLAEAMQKLANMYLNGDGVTLNYKKAAIWQERLVERLEDEHDENPSEELAKKIVANMDRLCKILHSLQLENEIMGWAEDMIYYHDMYVENCEQPYYWKEIKYVALHHLGKACNGNESFEDAESYYLDIISFTHEMFTEMGIPEYLRSMGNAQHSLVNVYYNLDRPEEAEKYLFDALKTFTILAEKQDSIADKGNFIQIYSDVGTFFSARKKDYEKARHYLSNAVLLAQQLNSENGTPQAKQLYAKALMAIGQNYYSPLNKKEDAAASYSKAEELFKAAYEQSGRPDDLLILANAFDKLSLAMEVPQLIYDAVPYAKKLYEDTGSYMSFAYLIKMYSNAAFSANVKGDPKKAAEFCAAAVSVISADNFKNNISVSKDIHGVYYEYGKAARNLRDRETAIKMFCQGLEYAHRAQSDATGESLNIVNVRLLNSYEYLYKDCWDCGLFDEATDYLQKYIQMFAENYYGREISIRNHDSVSFANPDSLSHFYWQLANMYSLTGQFELALPWYEKLLPKFDQQLKDFLQGKSSQRAPEMFYHLLAECYEAAGDSEKTEKYRNVCCMLHTDTFNRELMALKMHQKKFTLMYGAYKQAKNKGII